MSTYDLGAGAASTLAFAQQFFGSTTQPVVASTPTDANTNSGTPTTPTAPTPPPPSTNPFDVSAFDVLKNFFTSMGLKFDAELQGVIQNAMLAGYGPDKIDLIMPELEKTQSFQNRFPGFQTRISNGYNAISLGDYLQLENSYHRILQEAGLPAGFYDDPSDFGQWIANNVSPDEIQNRVQLATAEANKIDPSVRNLLTQFYGLGTGDLASYFLDQSRALPVIQRQYQTANIAAQAQKAGLAVNDIGHYESLLDQGLTLDAATQGYGMVKSLYDTVGRAASIYGDTYTQSDAEGDVFFNRNDKRRQIMSKEQATFNGRSRGETGSAAHQNY